MLYIIVCYFIHVLDANNNHFIHALDANNNHFIHVLDVTMYMYLALQYMQATILHSEMKGPILFHV